MVFGQQGNNEDSSALVGNGAPRGLDKGSTLTFQRYVIVDAKSLC